MLLTEWMKTLGVPAQAGSSLPHILMFSFGENYVVRMRDGRGFEDKNLEHMLSLMADEFRVWNTTHVLRADRLEIEGYFPRVVLTDPHITFSSHPKLAKRNQRSLAVMVERGWSSVLPPPDIECVVQQVREAVTMFSLTGEWDTIHKVNL